MTEKDLLDSLRFVDDDLIEEAGLEQLKEDDVQTLIQSERKKWNH